MSMGETRLIVCEHGRDKAYCMRAWERQGLHVIMLVPTLSVARSKYNIVTMGKGCHTASHRI